MFAAKLFALVAAFLAVSQVEAKKKRKVRVRDAVTRHCNAGQATFLIDGLSTK